MGLIVLISSPRTGGTGRQRWAAEAVLPGGSSGGVCDAVRLLSL